MNNFISSFSLYEFLRILMPGAYLTLNISRLVKYNFPEFDSITNGAQFNQIESTIIFSITAVVLGVLIYSFDNPRLLGYIFKSLPSNIIKSKHQKANGITVLNSYFAFYDTLPDPVKYKTEKQSGFLHLSLDMCFVNIFSIVFMTATIIWNSPTGETMITFKAHFIMVSMLLLVSALSAYFIYSKRLKYTYERSLDLYFQSNEYKLLLEKLKENNVV